MADQRAAVVPGESLSADLIAQTGFSSSRRGYEVKEVRDFLARIAGEVRELHRRIDAADAARRDAEERARHPRIDEETLAGAVGEETAAILRTARTAAAEIRAKAEEQATARLREAHAQADALRAEAEATATRRTAEAEEKAEALRAAALADAERTRSVAREEAELMRQQADHERRLTIESAQAIREKILSDLARRRRLATLQVDQLRAGRQRLMDAYALVRRNLDEVTDELQRAEGEARAAAEAVDVRAGPGAKDDLSEEDMATLRSTWPPAPPAHVPPVHPLAPDGPSPAPGASSPAEEAPEPAATAGESPPSTGGPGADDGGEAFEPTGVHPVLDLTDPRAPVADRSVPDAPPEPSPLAAAPPGRGGGTANGRHSPEGAHRVLAPDPDDEDAGARTPAAWAAASAPPPAGEPSPAPPAFDAGPATSGVEEPVTAPNAVLRLDEQEDTEVAADERPWVERVTDNDSVRIIRGGTVTATPRSGRSRSRRSGPGGQPGPLRPPAGDGPPSPAGEEPAGDGEVGAGPLAAETEAETPPDPAAETQAETPPDPPAETEAETAPEPAAPAGAGAQTPEPSAGPPPGAPSPSAADVVGGLFARIRAGQPPSAPGTPPVPAAAGDGPAGEAAAGEAAPGEEGGEAEAVLDGDELLLQRRDEAVTDVEVALSRRLKRVLQDEQNDLLDRLRGIRGTPKASAVLPALDVQRSALVDAGRRFLDQAATAGVGFGRAMVGSEAAAGAGEAPPVDDLAEEMADLIARPLRRRLEQAFADTAGDDQAVLVGALGAAYREWKTHRIEQLAGDAVAASFSRGSFEAVPPGTPLRWLVEDDDGPCPDCDDNALAGSLLRGELFPTGQAHPPAHAGCRCLLVTANDDS